MESISKRRIYKNLGAVSVAFLLIQGAYITLEGLQSSIHDIQGLGLASVMTLYACYGLSMFYSSAVVKRLGAKWSLVGAAFVHTSFVLVQYYPQWWSIVPISGLLGFVSGPLWLSEFVYIQKLTKVYVKYILPETSEHESAEQKDKKDEFTPVLRRFTDIFFAVFSASVLLGNLPAGFILSSEDENTGNATMPQCGIDFCPLDYSSSGKSTTDRTLLRIYIGVCLAINLSGVCTILFIMENDKNFDALIDEDTKELPNVSDKMTENQIYTITENNNTQEKHDKEGNTHFATVKVSFWREILDSAKETLSYVIDMRVILIVIPFWLLRGLFQGMFFSVFTLAFITCAMNIKYVGFHFVAVGTAAVILNFTTSWLTKILHVSVILLFFLILQIVIWIGWFLWTPSENTIYILFLLALGHGIITYGVWSQVQALIGSVFGDEKDPAYGIGNQCVCIGVIITTGLFQFACVKSLVYIKISLWAISIITYGIFELYYKPRFLGGK